MWASTSVELVERRGRRRRGAAGVASTIAKASASPPPRSASGEPALRRRGAMLDAEEEPLVDAAQIEIRVAPGVELRAAAQGLAAAQRARPFTRVMDEHDGEGEAALQLA